MSSIEWARLVVSIVLGGFALLSICCNLAVAFIAVVLRARAGSMIPLVGGALGFAAVLVAPFGDLQRRIELSWIPFALDMSWVSLLVVGPIYVPVHLVLSLRRGRAARSAEKAAGQLDDR